MPMEFICELIFEIILEGIFGLTVKNPKVKTWTKTAVFLLFAEAIAGFLMWMSVNTYFAGNVAGGIVGGVIALGLGIGFLIGAIYGHKREWKQTEY